MRTKLVGLALVAALAACSDPLAASQEDTPDAPEVCSVSEHRVAGCPRECLPAWEGEVGAVVSVEVTFCAGGSTMQIPEGDWHVDSRGRVCTTYPDGRCDLSVCHAVLVYRGCE